MADFGVVVSAPAGRFDGIVRPYSVEDVLRLRGSLPIVALIGAFSYIFVVGDIKRIEI